MFRSILSLAVVALTASAAAAQSLGTLSWQLQPYCNVVSVAVTGVAGVYTLEGFDDQCGAATRAPLTGVATPNPDGSVGFGMNLVTSPGGRGVQVEARISIATLSGPWTDSAGNKGTFAFGGNASGSPRPLPSSGLQADGGFVAGGVLNAGAIPASGAGTRMMWFPKRAAFRAGSVGDASWDEANVGRYSAAFGQNTSAAGESAVAFGFQTIASGTKSLAAGHGTQAIASQSVAFGTLSRAAGNESLALGSHSVADGQASVAGGFESLAGGARSVAVGYHAGTRGNEGIVLGGDSARGLGVSALGTGAVAIGAGSVAEGDNSVALGNLAQTGPGAFGTFVYGDRSSVSLVSSNTPNQFVVRAAGGSVFYTNGAMNAGVTLAPGAGAWSALSDVNSKQHFRDLDAGDVLAKIARMPIREWSYKAQDAAIRHVGPTAQDFHAAFGLGEDPRRISTVDADGIALAAVQALEARTRPLVDENAALRAQLARLADAHDALKARLTALAARLDEVAPRR